MNSRNIIKRMIYHMNPKHADRKMVRLWIFWIILHVVFFMIPREWVNGTFLLLAPMAGLFIYALTTKDAMQSIFLGTFSCYVLWYKGDCCSEFLSDVTVVLCAPENVEMYMSFFLCGGIIIAMKRCGCVNAFTEFVTGHFGENDKAIMVGAGIYSGVTSVDDYLSALTAGAAFSPMIDRVKKPRLALAYVIRTISICASALLPFGAWGYFIIYQLADADNVANKAEAFSIFLQSMPFIFYAIVATILALLFADGRIPKIGPMKEAYERMERDGVQMGELTDGSEKQEEDFDESDPRKKNVSIWNLIIPLIAIIAGLLGTGLNCFAAFAIATVVAGVLYVAQGLFTIAEYMECIVDGFLDMMDMVIILMLGYAMQECMYAMGMEGLIESVCRSIPVVSLLPFIFFVFFSCSEYLFSLNYTLYQIALPVMLEVLPMVKANIPLCVGAIISAGLFGANACVVSNLGMISARACRVTMYEQYRTSQPYVMIAGLITAILFLITGFVI